jgi:hypothetical protein
VGFEPGPSNWRSAALSIAPSWYSLFQQSSEKVWYSIVEWSKSPPFRSGKLSNVGTARLDPRTKILIFKKNFCKKLCKKFLLHFFKRNFLKIRIFTLVGSNLAALTLLNMSDRMGDTLDHAVSKFFASLLKRTIDVY